MKPSNEETEPGTGPHLLLAGVHSRAGEATAAPTQHVAQALQ
jgi:hypothetical protein